MAHGLTQLKWKALAVDRGQRFQPAKFLSDLWVTRSDWMTYFRGILSPEMRDGKWVRKPLMEISKNIIGKVADLDNKVFGYGSLDSMKTLRTLVMGGIGNGNFNSFGDIQTGCKVAYEGDVVVIFEAGEKSGKLTIQGSKPEDTVTLKNTAVFVPAGEDVVLYSSLRDGVDSRINRAMLRMFLDEAAGKWPESQRDRVVNEFVARGSLLSGKIDFGDFISTYNKIPDLRSIVEQVREHLDEAHQNEIDILSKVFKIIGALVYKTKFQKDEGKEIFHPYLMVYEGSKTGIGEHYSSRADKDWVPARDEKASTVIPGPESELLKIYINPVESGKGTSFDGFHYIAVPHIKEDGTSEIILLLGKFDESYNASKKDLFKWKFESLIKMAVEGRTHTPKLIEAVEKAFEGIPYQAFFERDMQQLFEEYIEKALPPKDEHSS